MISTNNTTVKQINPIDRTIQPEINPIGKIDFIKPRVFDISGQTKLYFTPEVPNETARIDLYFHAGSIHGNVGIASFVNGLILSGTATKTSTEINTAINDLGGYYESGLSNENAVITIHALRENLVSILEILSDALNHVAFHEKEVNELLADRKQKFKVNLEKVSFLAQRSFQQHLFNDSLYGRVVQESDFDAIDIKTLKEFHQTHYLNGLQKVVVIGNLPQQEIDQILDITGKWTGDLNPVFGKNLSNLKGVNHQVKAGALQSAIRVGRILFNKTHADYPDFLVLNTILGDYFGSRLMSNIREDKGYTYGIGSMVAELHETGYFVIGTEVGTDVRENTLHEIQEELKQLQNSLVDPEELELVKNYMLGQLLKSADGPYNMTDLYLGLEPYGLSMEFYNRCIESIQQITPKRIQELAKIYLNWEDMTVVSAG